MAGDELLRQLSTLLGSQLQASDTFSRIGGDEFGIILNHTETSDAIHIFEHLLTLINNFRFRWKNETLRIGGSMGVVSINGQSQNLNELLGAADAACYAAKDKGRNRIHLYQADDFELQEQRSERQWVSNITKALEDERFVLYKQPIVPLNPNLSNKPHYELLVRMVGEDGSIISPGAFIPAAERYGLMQKLDHWVIQHFFQTFQNHPQVKNDGIYAINLSGLSITDEKFRYYLKEQFTAYNVSPNNICFEVTETAAIASLSNAVRLIEEMKELGCLFSLDDFGSGMSSFAYIKHFPVDYLKVDGTFIKNILKDPYDASLVSCMNQIGHEFGMKTIAEFVENDMIFKKVQSLGLDYAQGYGIAKPSPLIVDTFG